MPRYRAVAVAADDSRFADRAALAPALPAERLAAMGRLFAAYGRYRHFLLLDGERPVGRVTAAVNPRLAADDRGRIGYLGDPVFPDDADALAVLLDPALDWLRAEGCAVARAPVTFHTWYPYRFVTDNHGPPPFPGEPANPPYVPARFAELGFATWQRYESRASDDLLRHVETNRAELDRLAASDLVVRRHRPERVGEELRALHALSHTCFSGNPSFTPVDYEEFRLVHAPFLAALRPEFLLLCEDPARRDDLPQGLAGFLLWYPDPRDSVTAVFKSIGVHPAAQGAGVGAAMTALAHRIAHAGGVRRVIHALMRPGRPPSVVSERSLPIYRRYSVMDRVL